MFSAYGRGKSFFFGVSGTLHDAIKLADPEKQNKEFFLPKGNQWKSGGCITMDAWKKRKLTFCKSPFCVLAKDCSLPKYCACHGLELLKYWTCRFKRFVDRPRSLACASKMDWSCHMLLFSVPQQHCRRGSSHPFFGHRLTNLFRSALFDDTFCLPSVSKAVSGVGV